MIFDVVWANCPRSPKILGVSHLTTTESVLIFVPTYNERENIGRLHDELQAMKIDCHFLFMDDNSPDGTGQLMDEIASKHPNVHVVHRASKLGIGSAHREGIMWAYAHGYKTLITMDCDFTHPPEYIPQLLAASAEHDIVVTSRYLQKGSLADWNLFRKALTKLGHFLTCHLLRMKYDATNAFRLYRLDRIPNYFLDLVSSNSYSFFFESLFILNFNRYAIKEVPIVLPARTYGHSKMRFRDAWYSLKLLLILFLNTLFNKEKFEMCRPIFSEPVEAMKNAEWDAYWRSQKTMGGLLYEVIAAFYRKFIIKPALNHFIGKYFTVGSKLLHAGCGGGQVDTDVCTHYTVTALDISIHALNMYNKVNKGKAELLHGSIFALPLPAGTVDGVYNLGVMEHFDKQQIRSILDEFARVLKPGGKMVLFWPPEYGISVVFFKILKIFLRPIYGKNIKFHPDEITRIQSRQELTEIVGEKFRIEEYYFGFWSLGTYAVVVLSAKI